MIGLSSNKINQFSSIYSTIKKFNIPNSRNKQHNTWYNVKNCTWNLDGSRDDTNNNLRHVFEDNIKLFFLNRYHNSFPHCPMFMSTESHNHTLFFFCYRVRPMLSLDTINCNRLSSFNYFSYLSGNFSLRYKLSKV